jgi:uncharacterized NAD(P)/FAD-binding protein YdhS
MSMRRVAIVGGGASGALQALHLLRAGASRVTLIERERAPGRGVAYSTGRPEHLLNVPARRMSAFPDDCGHFTRWFEARGGGADDFAPRRLYGDYLEALLAAAGDGLETVRGEAIDIVPGESVRLADGRAIEADAAVLAPGNFKPATPRGIDPAALGAVWVEDPWAGGLSRGLAPTGTILLLGTGLTAIDAALTLDAVGFGGRIVALSRRGLAPRGHGEREATAVPDERLSSTCVGLLRRVRERSAEIGWRSAVHELRDVTQDLWAGASEAERRRFLRHLRPWWDVHRHKIAPAIFERIEAMQKAARLIVAGARLVSAEPADGQALVRFRPRGSEAVETLRAARIVNCTGPEADIVRSGEPLLLALLDAGRIRPDAFRIGIDVDRECRTLDAAGRASDRLYAIGPVTRGAFWESVAVPDIRVQAQRVAERIMGTVTFPQADLNA